METTKDLKEPETAIREEWVNIQQEREMNMISFMSIDSKSSLEQDILEGYFSLNVSP